MNTAAADTLHDTTIKTRQEISIKSCTVEGTDNLSYNIGKVPLALVIERAAQMQSLVFPIGEEVKVLCPGAETANYMLTSQPSDVCTGRWTSFVCSSSDNRTIGMYASTLSNANKTTDHVGGSSMIIPITISNGVGSFNLKSVTVSTLKDREPMPGPISANYTLMIWGS
ncbi:hypothetical protein [Aeromonas sobria]|uniref:hypothetical protein n=1 Tax=Aeromonas sobria TaxID=646 RepID=UPI003F4123E6